MNTIEAKIYLLQAPGVNRVKDINGKNWDADELGRMWMHTDKINSYRRCESMHEFAPFTKVEPERRGK